MLDTLEPGELEESYHYSTLEPWGDDWERSSLITARLINSISAIAAGMSGTKLQEFDLIEDDAFVPKYRADNRTKRQKQQGDATDKTIAANDEINRFLGM
ncbi:MAG: hypothetical protein KDA57_17750 [Planctomycetales bacterium]|nr:hypothetical protein [Planctomycetales bacterium]